MAMIKRAKSGQIEEMTDKNVRVASTEEKTTKLSWVDDVLIKDVLDVPTGSETNIDVDLDEDDDDVIAVRT